MIRGFCIRGLFSVFLSRAMEHLTAELNHIDGVHFDVSDHGTWPMNFGNVPWLTEQSRHIHNTGNKIILVGHSFGGTAAIMVAQRLNNMGIPVELLCPLDPAGQYPDALVIPSNCKRVVGFFQKEPMQLGQGVDIKGRGWTEAEWKARTVDYQRYEGHLAIANDPWVHGKIIAAVCDAVNANSIRHVA